MNPAPLLYENIQLKAVFSKIKINFYMCPKITAEICLVELYIYIYIYIYIYCDILILKQYQNKV